MTYSYSFFLNSHSILYLFLAYVRQAIELCNTLRYHFIVQEIMTNGALFDNLKQKCLNKARHAHLVT